MADTFMERKDSTGMIKVEETREVAEIKAKMALARQFPRDEEYCLQRILKECESARIAETAQYEFPKGDSVVKGASIRLIEVISRHWGNLLAGTKEMERDGSKTTVKVFAWDLESNYSDEKIFELEFIRNTRKGSYVISDEREKYEMMANYAARRKRACIQAIIPGHVIDAAIDACEKTLEAAMTGGKDGQKKTIEEIRQDMLNAFVAVVEWVTPEMLGAVAGKDFDKLSTKDMVKLRNLYNAIKDGFAKPDVVFGREPEGTSLPTTDEEGKLNGLNEQLRTAANDTDKG